jgi:hypothetical protein
MNTMKNHVKGLLGENLYAERYLSYLFRNKFQQTTDDYTLFPLSIYHKEYL